jgi:hypothetical protein
MLGGAIVRRRLSTGAAMALTSGRRQASASDLSQATRRKTSADWERFRKETTAHNHHQRKAATQRPRKRVFFLEIW